MPLYRVLVHQSNKWSPQLAEGLIDAIISDKRLIARAMEFRIIGRQNGIEFRLKFWDEAIEISTVASIVRVFYPDSILEVVESLSSNQPLYPLHRRIAIFSRSSSMYFERTLSVYNYPTQDPLAILTQAMDDLRPNEVLEFALLWRGTYVFPEKNIDRELQQTHAQAEGKKMSDFNILLSWASGSLHDDARLVPRFSPADERYYRAKLHNPLHRAAFTLRFDTPDKSRLSLFTAVSSQIKTFSRIGDEFTRDSILNNDDEWEKTYPPTIFWDWTNEKQSDTRDTKLGNHTFYLSPQELAAFWHLPHSEFRARNLRWLKGGQARLPPQLQGRRGGVLVGNNHCSGNISPVRLSDTERLTHIHILGKTGTGKSTLMHHLIHQDIKDGKGVALIDPQGKLVQHILQGSIPENRERDVVVIDLANEEYPPPLNILGLPSGADQNNASGRIMAMLEKHGSFSDTVTVAPTLRAALVTLWQEKTPTVRDVVRVFTNEKYRQQLLAGVDNPVVDDFWEMFEAKTPGQREQLIAPVITRMTDLYGNPYLYPSICHPETLDFATLMEQRKIILVSLGVDWS